MYIFVNCIVMGIGEICAGLLSSWLMKRFKDVHVFLLANLLVAIFDTLFYFMHAGLLQYLCLLLTIFGVAT